MAFILLVAFSALFVAGCSAFFSIKGLIVLFSGSALAVGIMASSLEIGKLVTASFLHTHWKTINKLLKAYLCIAVLVLMTITSLGIFGFLTGAYQTHSAKVGTFDTRIEALAHEKSSVDQTTLELSNRIKTLSALRSEQEQRVKDSGNSKAPRDQAYKAIAEANEEIQAKEAQLTKERERSIAIDKEIADIKIILNTTTDIGSFKFIASALNTNVDTAVQYFIFTLIAVFDPLAVALVLVWSRLVEDRKAMLAQQELDFLSALGEEEEDYEEKDLEILVEEEPEIKQEVIEEKKEPTPEKPIAPANPVDVVSEMPIADESTSTAKKKTVEYSPVITHG